MTTTPPRLAGVALGVDAEAGFIGEFDELGGLPDGFGANRGDSDSPTISYPDMAAYIAGTFGVPLRKR